MTASGAAPSAAPAAPLLPLPQPDPATQPYWDSLRAHALRLPWCLTCDRAVFYPRPVCPRCLGDGAGVATRQRAGHAVQLHHRPPGPAAGAAGGGRDGGRRWAGAVPYVVALVDLEEGVRLMANLAGVAPDPTALRIGTPLELDYEDVDPGGDPAPLPARTRSVAAPEGAR